MNSSNSDCFHRIDRPREKLISRGGEALSDTELVAVLLGCGVQGISVISVARGILARFGAKGLTTVSIKKLKEQKGVGGARACALVAAVELGKRLFEKPNHLLDVIDGPESVYRLARHLSDLKKEHFIAYYLNAKNHVIKRETVSIGSLFANMVHPREVFAPALEVSAAAVVLAHNHPSGDPEPSPEDRLLTMRLCEAGKLMGIEVLDHLVVGKGSFVSFQERHYL